MIQQKVTLCKLITDDGYFDFTGKAIVGLEFWVECNSFQVMKYRRTGTELMFDELTVRTEDGNRIPVSVLEFSSEFRITHKT